MSEVTRILQAIENGEPTAAEQLLPLVYEELRKLATARMAAEKPGHTLQATALVHEAYLRLVGEPARHAGGAAERQRWNGRGHFFAAAAEAMRRILVENARRKSRVRHGGGLRRVELDGDRPAPLADEQLLELDVALRRLARLDPIKARLVELRYFAGLSGDEAAGVLGISPSAADRYWTFARAWLRREMDGQRQAGQQPAKKKTK